MTLWTLSLRFVHSCDPANMANCLYFRHDVGIYAIAIIGTVSECGSVTYTWWGCLNLSVCKLESEKGRGRREEGLEKRREVVGERRDEDVLPPLPSILLTQSLPWLICTWK